MADFHEVERPDGIGRVAGFGKSTGVVEKKSPQLFGGSFTLEL